MVTKLFYNWVLEGSLAGISWRHEMALELVCRADFWCNRHCKTSPVDLEGFGGQVWPKIGRKPTQQIPARLPSGTQYNKYTDLSSVEFDTICQAGPVWMGLWPETVPTSTQNSVPPASGK